MHHGECGLGEDQEQPSQDNIDIGGQLGQGGRGVSETTRDQDKGTSQDEDNEDNYKKSCKWSQEDRRSRSRTGERLGVEGVAGQEMLGWGSEHGVKSDSLANRPGLEPRSCVQPPLSPVV